MTQQIFDVSEINAFLGRTPDTQKILWWERFLNNTLQRFIRDLVYMIEDLGLDEGKWLDTLPKELRDNAEGMKYFKVGAAFVATTIQTILEKTLDMDWEYLLEAVHDREVLEDRIRSVIDALHRMP